MKCLVSFTHPLKCPTSVVPADGDSEYGLHYMCGDLQSHIDVSFNACRFLLFACLFVCLFLNSKTSWFFGLLVTYQSFSIQKLSNTMNVSMCMCHWQCLHIHKLFTSIAFLIIDCIQLLIRC